MTEYHSYDPASGHRLPHDPIKAIVAPRPIGWISTLGAQGQANLAPYSYFNLVSARPPIVMFSSDGWKDSVRNIEASGEFVFNLATKEFARAMNISAAEYGPGIDEFKKAGLNKLKSALVAAPRVAGAAAAMECKVTEIRPLKDMDGRTVENILVLGQVVQVHIDTRYLCDGLFDISRAQSIARCGYRGDYVVANQVFEMLRPKPDQSV